MNDKNHTSNNDEKTVVPKGAEEKQDTEVKPEEVKPTEEPTTPQSK